MVGNAGRFAYACDALLGLPLSDTPPAMVRRADGSLLLGSASGLRATTAEGCPRPLAGELANVPVYALAGTGSTIFAFAGDGVYRSTDAGESWQLRSPFASGAMISALIHADGKLYASRGTSVLVSSDDGASFEVSSAERALTLLAVDTRLWAAVRSATAVGNRGTEIWRAATAAGPWRSVLALNYFGGLTIDAEGTVWVGDEGGGLFRSLDGETFTNVAPELYPSCLQADGARIYSCNEDLPSQPALFDTSAPVVKLADVEQLVACEGVTTICAAAWVEWQRDVLLRPILPNGTFADAAVPDAGVADAGVSDASSIVDAEVDASVQPRTREDGCHLGSRDGAPWALALALLATRRRKLGRA
ncbi:MAG TPA: hypothetical protein VFX59_10620 [Polyangiales bacterium]|nr:hypothetical protein [Polyangiales bacterium]